MAGGGKQESTQRVNASYAETTFCHALTTLSALKREHAAKDVAGGGWQVAGGRKQVSKEKGCPKFQTAFSYKQE